VSFVSESSTESLQEQEKEFSFGEELINQAIETIEFVLGIQINYSYLYMF
jgi:hypothetical protein